MQNVMYTSERRDVVLCINCKHRPEYDPPDSRKEYDLVFPDDVCPMKCGDNWYSKRMEDGFFCARGEQRGDNAPD